MAKRDFYTVLGVNRDASDDDLKKSYRKLAMKHHPDRNPDDKASEEKFKEAKEAFEILSDPKKRAAYDQFGHAGVDPSVGGGRGPGPEGFGGFADAFGDIFGEIFGQQGRGGRGGGGSGVFRGADLRYNLELSLEDAARGAEVKIRIPTMEACETCHGSGCQARHRAQDVSQPATAAAKCACRRASSRSSRRARRATARGKVVPDPCGTCHGAGRVKKHKTLSVKIPAGVDQDDRIRLTGEGEAGVNGGPSGDLYVVVNLKQHAVFQRDGADLHCEMPMSFATAALGGDLEIPTLDGHATIKVPPETQTGQTFRLRNKGIRPVRGSVQGDLDCHVVIETPVKLTSRQKDLLREFESINQEDPGKHNPRAKGWFEKVKEFFGD